MHNESALGPDHRLMRGIQKAPARMRVVSEMPVVAQIESIIGDADDRTRITDTESDPWRRICCLEITGRFGSGTGTGWLVGPNTIVTAGHCVFDRRIGGWADSIRVIPGRDDSHEPFPQAVTVATRFSSVRRWVEDNDRGYDFGAIHLDQPIGEVVGWFGFASLSADRLRNFGVNIAGYAGDKKFEGRRLAFHSGRVLQVDERRVYYDADTMGGQSGGPVWIHTDEKPDEPVVVGIHAYGEGGTPGQFEIEANSAPRILPSVYDVIQQWIESDSPTT